MKHHCILNSHTILSFRMIRRLLPASIFLILLLDAGAALGQQGNQRQPSRGFQFANSYASNGLDAVNVSNGNVMINLPIASLPAGRGTSPGFTVSLQYNSKLWDSRQYSYTDGLSPGSQDLPPEPTYAYTTNVLRPNERGGWRMLSSYRLIETSRLNLEEPNPCTHGHAIEKLRAIWKLEMEFPDGTVRQFIPTYNSTSSSEGYYNINSNGRRYWASNQPHPNGICTTALSETQVSTTGMYYMTTDGSRLSLFVPYQSSNWKMYFPDGTIVENAPPDDFQIQRITERNGGKVEIRGNEIVDQMGRSITLSGSGVTVKGADGASVTTQIAWGSRWVRREYRTVAPGETVPSGTALSDVMLTSVPTIESITLPSQLGGQSYTFDYYASTSQPTGTNYTSGWGELKSVMLPSGAKATYAYDLTTGATNTAEEVLDNKVNQRQLEYTDSYDGVQTLRSETSYYSSFPGNSSFSNPDGTGMSEQSYFSIYGSEWNSGLAYSSATSDGTKVERVWKQNLPYYGGSPYPYQYQVPGNANAYVKTEFTTITNAAWQNSLTAIKDYNYDKNGNVTKITDYDWVSYGSVPRQNGQPSGIPAGAIVKRITVNEYYNQAPDSESTASSSYTYENPASPKLKNVLKATEIRDAGNTPVSRSEFFYDDPDNKGNLIETRTWDNTKAGLYASDANGSKLYTTSNVSNYVSATTVYDSYGNPTLITDANGNQTQIMYGPINGPAATYSGLYPTEVRTAYNTAVQQTTQTEYDFYIGQAKRVTAFGNTSAENVVAETVYDAVGRPTIVKSAVGTPSEAWTRTDYNDVQRRLIVRTDLFAKDDGKKVAIQHFDQLGRVRLARTLEDSSTQDPTDETQGIKIQTRYLTANPYTYVLTSNPYRANYSYDETAATMGWTRSTSWNTGKRSEMETYSGYALPAPWGTNAAATGIVTTDIDANATTVTDQAARQRRSVTNALGQLIRVDEPDKITGQLGSITAPVQPTNYEYNTLGKMVHVQQDVQHRWFMYDSLGRMLRVKQPEQDVNGGLNTTGNPGNDSWTAGFAYDNNGNVLTATDAKGTTTTNTYDALNRPLTRTYSDGTATVTNTYDDPNIARSKGKLTKVANGISESRYTQFDEAGRLKQFQQFTDETTYTSSYEYNLSGALIKETYPSLRVVENEFDASGDLAKILGKATPASIERTYANNFTYSPDGKIERLRLGSGVWESAKFNSRLQVTELAVGWGPSSGSIWKMTTEFGEWNGTAVDAVKNSGNIGKQTVSFSGLAQPFVQTFSYDALQRLTEAKETSSGNQTWREIYDYDRYGNRTTHNKFIGTNEVAQTDETRPEIDAAKNRFKPTEGYTFDANGNIIVDFAGRQFTFNGDNKQTQVKDGQNRLVGKYYYDGEGKRVKKLTYDQYGVEKDVTVFVYSNGKLIAEYTTEAPPQNPTTRFTITDQLGSPRVILDSAGDVVSRRDFLPFGEEIAPDTTYRTDALKYGRTDNVRQKFTGYQNDAETGLDFAEARMYENRHGRFTAIDPLLASGKSADPQTFNRYVYVMNKPLVLSDPNGLQAGSRKDDLTRGCRTNCVGSYDSKTNSVSGSSGSLIDLVVNVVNEVVDQVNTLDHYIEYSFGGGVDRAGDSPISRGFGNLVNPTTEPAINAFNDGMQQVDSGIQYVPIFSSIYNQQKAGYFADSGRGSGANAMFQSGVFVADLGTTLFSGGGSSRVLGRNMLADGAERSAGSAAHHIVSSTHQGAAIARSILGKAGININDAANGVFLPATKAVAEKVGGVAHSGVHTGAYYEALTNRLLNTQNVKEELRIIGKEIVNGTFPY